MSRLNIIDILNLSIYNSEGHAIVKDVNLNIKAQQINALIGESGAGKSLTAKAILNALPSALSSHYDEYLFEGKTITQVHHLLGKKIGYISQNYTHSFNEHSKLSKQLIAIYRMHYDVSKQEALEQIKRALEWVNLTDHQLLNRYSFQLSGGQLERLYIASVLMLDPELIIADEPVASLDVLNGQRIMDLLQHIVKEHHNTLLIITHNMSHVLKYSDYINVLKDGQIVEQGPISHFENDNLHPYTQALINYRTKLKRADYD